MESINTQLDLSFIFFKFYDGFIVATIMITCQILIYFLLLEHVLKMIRNIYVILRVHKVFKLHKLKVSLGKSLNGCNSAIMGSCYLKFDNLLFFCQVDHISKTKENSWWSLSQMWFSHFYRKWLLKTVYAISILMIKSFTSRVSKQYHVVLFKNCLENQRFPKEWKNNSCS